MKHLLKITSLLVAMLILGACGNTNDAAKEKSTEEATTQVNKDEDNAKDSDNKDDKASDKDAAKDSNDSDKEASTKEGEEASSEGDASEASEGDEQAEEVSEDAASFKFYINGEEDPELAFSIEDAEGMSVLEALQSQEDLNVNFNEEEGIVDSINGIDNNYETWESWAYLLNGQFAELGVVSQTLSAGDEIEWYYGTTDAIPVNILPAE